MSIIRSDSSARCLIATEYMADFHAAPEQHTKLLCFDSWRKSVKLIAVNASRHLSDVFIKLHNFWRRSSTYQREALAEFTPPMSRLITMPNPTPGRAEIQLRTRNIVVYQQNGGCEGRVIGGKRLPHFRIHHPG
jgi:hypothetical protein